MAAAPLPLPKHERGLLWWHNFYRPEHHPNHPARVLKLGSPVEVGGKDLLVFKKDGLNSARKGVIFEMSFDGRTNTSSDLRHDM